MAKQSELERLGIEERKDEFIHSPYDYSQENPYNAGHVDATSDGDKRGKGTNDTKPELHTKAHKDPKSPLGITINTDNGGGLYDIKGTVGVEGAFQGSAGREYLLNGGINLYNPQNEYGRDSVDTTKNREEGQYFVQ